MEKPTKALLPEIFNAETDEDFANVIGEAATVYANLIVELVQQFGVNAIPELKPEQFGAFATALRGMGAQI